MSAPNLQYPPASGGGTPVGGSGTPGTIPVWSGTGTTLGDSIVTQPSSSQISIVGNVLTVGKSGAGLGGNFRSRNDSGTEKWLMGLLGSAGASAWTLYDLVNAQTRVAVDGTTGNVGIGTASPARTLEVQNGVAYQIRLGNSTASTAFTYDIGRSTSDGLLYFFGNQSNSNGYVFSGANGERVRIDSVGRLLVGTATAAASSDILCMIGGATRSGMEWNNGAGGGALLPNGANNLNIYAVSGGPGAETYTFVGAITNTSLNLSVKNDFGVKLNATPGNADTQTLDCYQENPLASTAGNGWTPTLSAAATWGGTQPTVDYARYIRIGSLVFCEVRLSGAAISATYGSTTISQPPVTMNAFAYESAVSVSTGVGSGVGVCTSTSVLLPTLGATAVMRLSWFYFTTS